MNHDFSTVFRYVNLAAALTSIQDWEGAIQAHRDALNINGNLFGVRSDLGNIFKSLGRLDEAEVCNHFLTRTGPSFIQLESYVCIHVTKTLQSYPGL